MVHDPTMGRRAALAAGAASLLTACSPRTAPAVTSVNSSIPLLPTALLPAFAAWQPHSGEKEVAAKVAAVRRIEQLGDRSGHRLHVIDAQYGGLLSDSASVLVVCESWRVDGARVVPDGHTFDVRVGRTSTGWQVTAIHPSAPRPSIDGLSIAARQVLRSSRITLPPAARADIKSGQVHDTALEAMLTLSRRWSIAISVIRSGHPLYVFGTSRLSDHPQGRAFDTWALDQIPIVAAGAPHPAVPAYMQAVASAGSYNVGGPVFLGPAPQFFTDQTHHDHVHAGFAS